MARISTRYATAFFELAVEHGVLDALTGQVAAAKEFFGDAGCKGLINHPNITKEEKYKFLDDSFAKAFPSGIHSDLKAFLHLLVAKNRENVIEAALGEFLDMAADFKRETVARVTAAAPLTAAQTQEIKREVSKQLNKQVELSVKVDPSLIGGVLINVDGLLIDYSVKNQLTKLEGLLSLSPVK